MKNLTLLLIIVLTTIMIAKDNINKGNYVLRPAINAGRFYPENADTLKGILNDFLKLDAIKKIDNSTEIIGLISPHAGYVYSGWVAGKAYRELLGKQYDVIIIIAPSHYKSFHGVSVYNGDGYATALGNVNIDTVLSKEIASLFPEVYFSTNGHDYSEQAPEHSIEVQLPFLQIVQPNVPIVAISMGSQDFETTDLLTKAIVKSVKKLNRKPLLVASSDLSHYHSVSKANKIDTPLVNSINNYDYFKLAIRLKTNEYEACGGAPIVAVMMASELLGANSAETMLHTTSADSPIIKTDTSRVVGYCSSILYKSNNNENLLIPDFSPEDTLQLLRIAKKSIDSAVISKNVDNIKIGKISENLSQEFAAFVTLKKQGELRGCIGHTFASSPLYQEVEETARLAALNDPRFNAVKQSELSSLEIEVTVLSRLKKILSEDEIQVGCDGVYLRLGRYSAIFLPIVAKEYGWDRKTLLEQLCRKAGLPINSQNDPRAELYIYQGVNYNANYNEIK